MDAHDWDLRYAESDLVWSATPNQLVAGELAELPPGRSLDLAAGEGRNALWLAEGAESLGVRTAYDALVRRRTHSASLPPARARRRTSRHDSHTPSTSAEPTAIMPALSSAARSARVSPAARQARNPTTTDATSGATTAA